MNKKKILWIIILLVFIAVISILVISLSKRNVENTTTSSNIGRETVSDDVKENDDTSYIRTKLDDGVLYSKTGEKVTADIVIGDNYFDTTINDMFLNPNTYKGKKIEIEGFYLSNPPWTFVGRYSTSNLCAYCPVGYSYLEYQLDGTIDRNFTNEKEWIKIVGTLETGNDASSNYEDYYYLKVLTLEVMNGRGKETVNN